MPRKSLATAVREAVAEVSTDEIILVDLAKIRRDGGTQARPELNPDHVDLIRSGIQRNQRIPPIDVDYDGKNYWLWDGFHRMAAYEAEGLKAIQARIHQGTQRTAVWKSFHANSEHLGLPRSHSTIRRILTRVFDDPEWAQYSNSSIARHVGCDEKTVRNYRKKLEESQTSDNPNSLQPEVRLNFRGTPINPKDYGQHMKEKAISARAVSQAAIALDDAPVITAVTIPDRVPAVMPTPLPEPEPVKPVLPEFVPKLEDLWTLGKHRVYCGHSSDEKFQSMLDDELGKKRAALAFATIPPGYEEDWSLDWLLTKANLVAILVQEANAIVNITQKLNGVYLYAMGANVYQQWGWLGFFGKNLPTDGKGEEIIIAEDATLASANQLFSRLLALYTKGGDTTIVVDGPAKGEFYPVINCQELGRRCLASHVMSGAIARETAEFRSAYKNLI